jgi:hypothetical protein
MGHGPKITLPGLKISLLSVVPGEKSTVAKKLEYSILRNTGTPPIAMLKLFGQFDLCAIYQTSDFLSGPSRAGSIAGIRSSNQILAFPYMAGPNDRALFASSFPVWGLLFFRINEVLAKRFGAVIEEVLAKGWFGSNSENVSIDLLGTTGWAELAFVARSASFSRVATVLSGISREMVAVSTKGQTEKHLFAAKTYSLFGVDYRYLDVKKTTKAPEIVRLLDEHYDDQGIHPIVGITCAPGDMRRVHEYASRALGKGYSTFGSTDLVYDLSKCATWGKMVADIVKLRRALSGSVYSTSISILHPQIESDLADAPVVKNARHGITVRQSLLNQFRRWGPDFENRLLNLYFGISNSLQDPLVGDCFEDIRKAAAEWLPELLAKLSPDDDDDRMLVLEVVETLSYGANERAHGAFLSIEHVEDRFSPTKGGIQRVLRAAQYIPRQVMARLGFDWKGFVISGFQNRGFSSHGQIINLPLDYLFRPEEWWGLFHEAGHVALWDTEFIDLLGDPVVSKQLQDVVPSGDRNDLNRWKNIYMELGADSFDLYFCHCQDIDMFLKDIWSYLQARLGTEIRGKHFARYFCIFQLWRHLLRAGKKNFPKRMRLEEDVQAFIAHLKEIGLWTPDNTECWREAENVFRASACVLEVISTKYSSKKPKRIRSVAEDRTTDKALRSVLRGQVYADEIILYPDQFVLALKRNSEILDLKVRLAAIMSLWHSAMLSEAQ